MMKTSHSRISRTIFNTIMVLAVVLSSFGFPKPAHAAAILTIQQITWNVIGLDSNKVESGPDDFPVGVRVCNTGDAPATNVSSKFYWDDAVYSGMFTSSPDANPYINLRDGTLQEYKTANGHSVATLAAGACTDFYYEVVINRTSAAYDKVRGYLVRRSHHSRQHSNTSAFICGAPGFTEPE